MNRALFIAWRSGGVSTGRWGPVGRLDRADGHYRFIYTQGARMLDGFRPFSGMSDLDGIYESEALFPLFANRLLAASRPEYEQFLAWGGFDPDNQPDPIAILSVTGGQRATDAFEVFPCPVRDSNGCFASKFFLRGIRWMPSEAQDRILALQPGNRLMPMFDVLNPRDQHAVAVRTLDTGGPTMIGYVPRYLACDVLNLCKSCEREAISFTVERLNADAPLQQRLLCQFKACWPDDFRPCCGDEFQPIISESLLSQPHKTTP